MFLFDARLRTSLRTSDRRTRRPDSAIQLDDRTQLSSGLPSSSSPYALRRLYSVFRLTPSAFAARRLSPPQYLSVPRMICFCASASGVTIHTLIESPSVTGFFTRDIRCGCGNSTDFSARMNARYTAFFSSRTLPGHDQVRSVSSDRLLKLLLVPSC